MTVDEFGLPTSILGRHPDEFYGAVGRIVCVSSVLEQQLSALRHSLAKAEQGAFTHQPVSGQIAVARDLVSQLPEDRRPPVLDFLDRSDQAVKRRNAVVHSAFPAQSAGQLLGHKPVRDHAIRDGSAEWTVTNMEEMRALVASLSRLVLDFNDVFALSQTSAL